MMTNSILGVAARLTGALAVIGCVALGVGCADLATQPEDYYHPPGFAKPGDADFHGEVVLASPNGFTSCTTCHGEDHTGGTSGVACSSCHAVYPHSMASAFGSNVVAGHVTYLTTTAGWDLTECQSCHGEAYDGNGDDYDHDGVADKTCLTCHDEDDGPEACSTCHGDGDIGVPPPDLLGSTLTSARGVGAHEAHVPADAGSEVCVTCHVVPADYASAGHIDALDGKPARDHADIVFGGLATHDGAMPTYDSATATCGSTYCHGAFAFAKADSPFPFGYVDDFITGNSASVVWNDVGSGQAVCGSCHGLYPTGHWDRSQCESCHTTFPETHIDGRIDAIGESRDP